MRRRTPRSTSPGTTGRTTDERSPAAVALLRDLPVLIVDPDRASARGTEKALAEAGCATRVAHDAEQALAVLQDFPARVILLDLVLPGMSGLVLAHALATDADTREIAIVAVTAFADADAARLAREAGCATHLRKPVPASRFLKVIVGQLRGDA